MKSGLDIATGLDKLENEFPESLKGYTGLESAFLNLPPLTPSHLNREVIKAWGLKSHTEEQQRQLDAQRDTRIHLQRLALLPELAMALAVAIDTSTDILDGFMNHPEMLNGHSTKDMIRNVNEIIYNNITRVTAILENDSPHSWAVLFQTCEQVWNDNPTWEEWQVVLQVVFN